MPASRTSAAKVEKRASGRRPGLSSLSQDQVGAVALALAADPSRSRHDIAREAGVSVQAVTALDRRLSERHLPAVLDYRSRTRGELVEGLEATAHQYLEHLQRPGVVSEASAKDASITLGVLIDKAQLLKGEPTQIMSVEQRMQLEVLMRATVEILESRGHTIDATATAADGAPEVRVLAPEADSALRKTATERKMERFAKRGVGVAHEPEGTSYVG